MSNPYEVEHSITPSQATKARRRPSMSTFTALLSSVTSPDSNASDIPPPASDVAAINRLVSEQILALSQTSPAENALLEAMFSHLQSQTPSISKGVSQEFLDALERVPRAELKDESCPICSERYADGLVENGGDGVLVVRLPCDRGGRHIFDLECVGPWLRTQGTCPLDRLEVDARGRERREADEREERRRAEAAERGPRDDYEDEEYDEMFA